MTRVSARSKGKVVKVNGCESKENTKETRGRSQDAKESAKSTKVPSEDRQTAKAEANSKARSKTEVSKVRNIVKKENLDLAAEIEALLKKVNVEGTETDLDLKEEVDEEDDEEEEEEEEEEVEELDDEADKEEDDVDEDGDEDEEDESGSEESDKKEAEVGYQCDYCEYTFTRKSMLKRHTRIHTGERPYACDKCDAKFTQQGGLKTHVLCKHRDQIDQKDKITYQCHHCDRSFVIKERLRIHLRVHTGELPYVCHICSKKFRRNGGLLQHLRRHVGMRPYTCEICKASYYNSTNLKTHMKRHLGVQDYVCDLCGKGFTRRDGLRKHLACLHYDQCAFTCSICNKAFKGHILSHLRMHLKEKPFKCEICGMRFVQSSQLVVHTRTHTGAKPYPCQICKVAFSHSSALRMHIRRHTGEKPVKCMLCPAAFVQLPHLKKHMRCIHKSDKPYVCVPCNVFFKKKVELEEHMKAVGCKPVLAPEAVPKEDSEDQPAKSSSTKRSRKRPAKVNGENAENKKQKLEDKPQSSDQVKEENEDDPLKEVDDIPNLKGAKVVQAYQNLLSSEKKSEKCNELSAKMKSKSKATLNNNKPNTKGVNSDLPSTESPEVPKKAQDTALLNQTKNKSCKNTPRETRSSGKRLSSSSVDNSKSISPKIEYDELIAGSQIVSPSSSRRSSCESKTTGSIINRTASFNELASANNKAVQDDRCGSPICEPLRSVDHPTNVMVEEMMRKVTERLKLGAKTPIILRNQPMPIEKIRMLLAILLKRISTPDQLEGLGFGKILIDKVLCASIINSGRVPCDTEGLSDREVILKNVQILLDWTVPKYIMDDYKRKNRSTEYLLEELTSSYL